VYAARQHVLRGRDSRREQLLRRLHKVKLKKIDRSLGRLIADVSGGEAPWSRGLAARLTRRTTRLREALRIAGAMYVPDRLHAVRIACKKLRYALEIAAELGIAGAAKLAKTVRRSQVTLGHLQDRHVLLGEVHEAEAASSDDAARQGLLTLATHLEQAGRELHGQFLAQHDALDAAIESVRRDVVPALISRSRPQLPAALPPEAARRRSKRADERRAAGER
jgi:CHAD domain-containing protein